MISLRLNVFSALASLALALPALACGPDALGTARSQSVGGGVVIGLKTYPQTLALHDHEVVLTFDDGPLPGPTSRILDALKAECVQATFFLIGRNAQANPALVRRELAEGHTIGHHTWSHPAVTLRGLAFTQAQQEIDRGMRADDTAAYGQADSAPQTPFFRYPGFGDSPALNQWLQSRGITIFGTDLWASDWNAMSPQAELSLIMQRLDAAGRGIILFHDTKNQTAQMLPAFLRELKAKSYRIVHIVPGRSTPLQAAPAGWSSETERTMHHMGM